MIGGRLHRDQVDARSSQTMLDCLYCGTEKGTFLMSGCTPT